MIGLVVKLSARCGASWLDTGASAVSGKGARPSQLRCGPPLHSRARRVYSRVPIVGGLITSTALSLIVIPAAYTVLHDIGDWFVRKFSRKRTAGDLASAH